MAAPANAPPDPGGVKPTYAAMASTYNQPPIPPITSRPKRGLHKGEPAGYFPPDLLGAYSKPFQFAMVGKFSHGRPEMKDIHSFFKAQDFHGQYAVGLLNFRHILVNFQDQQDFHRFYSRMLWYVGDFPMRVFKWTPDFHPERESSLVPVWFKFPNLPIHFFNKDALFFLASLFGTPFRLDSATISLKRPSIARIQIEIDLLKPLPGRLWIGTGESQGFWQRVEPDEALPLYCSYCWHVGHSEDTCTVNHPELLPVSKCDDLDKQKQSHVETLKKTRQRQEYRRKQVVVGTLQEHGTLQEQNDHTKSTSESPLKIVAEVQKLPAELQSQETGFKPLLIESHESEIHAQIEVGSALPLATLSVIAVDSEVFPVAVTLNENTTTANPIFGVADEDSTLPIDANFAATAIDENPIITTDVNAPMEAETPHMLSPNHDQHPVPMKSECQQAVPEIALEFRQELHLQDHQDTMPSTLDYSGNLQMAKTSLNPNAPAFFSATPSEPHSSEQSPVFWPLVPYTNEHISIENTIGLHADYYQDSESDKLEDDDEDIYFDITDGSEDTIRQKRKGQKKSKGSLTQTPPTKEYLEEQSHKLGKKIKKKR